MSATPVAQGAVRMAYPAYPTPPRRNGRERTSKAIPAERKPFVNLYVLDPEDHLITRRQCILDTTGSPERCLSPMSAGSERADLSRDLRPAPIKCLPVEIRLMIFQEVLRVEEVRYEHIVLDLPSLKLIYPGFVNLSRGSPKAKHNSVLCILQVCRQFYHEAAPIFYEVNHLRLSTPVMLFYFLRDLPRTRRHNLRHLRIGGVGFDRAGWQLTRRAFSMLALCPRLQTVEIDLVSDSLADFDAWTVVACGQGMTEQADVAMIGFGSIIGSSFTLAIEELHVSMVCLMARRKLRSIKINMVCREELLQRLQKDTWPVFPGALREMQRTMDLWITRLRLAVT